MLNLRIIAAAFLLTCLPIALSAASPKGSGSFFKQVPGTDRQVPITSAAFTDRVVFNISISADNGEYPMQITIYDGSGKEVYNAQSTLLVKNGRGGAAILYGFKIKYDVPGTWWYVVAVDNKVIFSSSVDVSQ